MYNGYFAVRRRPLTPLTPLRWLDEMAIKKQQQLWTIGSFIFRVANSTAGEMQERDTIARPDVFFYPTTGHNQIMTFHIFIFFSLSLSLPFNGFVIAVSTCEGEEGYHRVIAVSGIFFIVFFPCGIRRVGVAINKNEIFFFKWERERARRQERCW